MSPLLRTLMKKEMMELFYSTRGLLFFLLISVVLSAFSLMLVTNTELSLLDNAQALYMMSGIVLVLTMLIAAVYGSDAIAGERERRTLSVLLVTPLNLQSIVRAKLCFVLLLYVAIYLVGLPYFIAVGSSGQNLLEGLIYLFFLGVMLSLIFSAVGIYVSLRATSYKAAQTIMLVIVLFSASPLLLSASLRQSTLGRVADYINPFADAVNTLDAVIIDSEPFSLQLLRLGILAVITLLAVVLPLYRAKKELS
jgi:ABC-type transport system involved in multi-copper enzyme maturation permease subunit